MKRPAFAALVLFVSTLALPSDASAACVAPTIQASPATAAPGEAFEVRGHSFAAECRDVVTCEVGKPCPTLTPSPPSRDISLDLRQGSHRWRLATVDAGSDYTFVARVRVPAGAGPGEATIVADGQWTTAFRVSLAKGGTTSPIGIALAVLAVGVALRLFFVARSRA